MNLTTKDRILQFIDYKGINKTVFLNDTKIKRGFLDKDKLGASVSDLLLEKIIKTYPEIDLLWLISGQGNMLKALPACVDDSTFTLKSPNCSKNPTIPLYFIDSVMNAGHPKYNESTISIPHMPNCDAALYIHGDTMYPILRTGDIVCYKRIIDMDNIYWGEMYVMDILRENKHYLTLKYIQKSELGDDYLSVCSHNPVYPPQDILKVNVSCIGLVKVCVRYNSLV